MYAYRVLKGQGVPGLIEFTMCRDERELQRALPRQRLTSLPRENTILLPNTQRKHRTVHIQNVVLPYACREPISTPDRFHQAAHFQRLLRNWSAPPQKRGVCDGCNFVPCADLTRERFRPRFPASVLTALPRPDLISHDNSEQQVDDFLEELTSKTVLLIHCVSLVPCADLPSESIEACFPSSVLISLYRNIDVRLPEKANAHGAGPPATKPSKAHHARPFEPQ